MLVYLAWTLGGLLMLACGWFASAWYYQRRIVLLQVQLKVIRQTAAAHADQARRQIGQLQADLAGRPHPTQPMPLLDAQDANAPLRPRRRAGVDQKFVRQDDGFPQTAIAVRSDGFAPTEMLS